MIPYVPAFHLQIIPDFNIVILRHGNQEQDNLTNAAWWQFSTVLSVGVQHDPALQYLVCLQIGIVIYIHHELSIIKQMPC